jgi:ribosomal protein S18 acetylase RimI-like enzyme
MQVYPAELTDLNACYYMFEAYTTDYVWQLQTTNHDEHRLDIRFDTIRLPRSMQVGYPRSPDELLEHWHQEGCFLVVQNTLDEVIGFIDAQPHFAQGLLWISNLIVDKNNRRQGIGTLLLKSARRWAEQQQLRRMMLEVQTKNYPAISFAQKLGFKFCGYNERYYPNGDIALFFYQNI